MRRDSKLSDVLHVLLHLADRRAPATSESLASMIGTNPVVVRRTLSGLREQGLVSSAKGRAGGWTLTCDLAEISLLDIYRAVGEPTLFAIGSRNPSSQCLVEKAVNHALSESLERAEALLLERLDAITLQALYEQFSNDMAAIREALEAAEPRATRGRGGR